MVIYKGSLRRDIKLLVATQYHSSSTLYKVVNMTKLNLTKPLCGIKSFLFRSKKRQAYIQSLEAAYIQKSAELHRLQRLLNHC